MRIPQTGRLTAPFQAQRVAKKSLYRVYDAEGRLVAANVFRTDAQELIVRLPQFVHVGSRLLAAVETLLDSPCAGENEAAYSDLIAEARTLFAFGKERVTE